MRTITYMKGGQVLTRQVPDLTAQEQAAIDARKAVIANKRLQRQAADERASLRTAAIDQIIADGAISQDLRDYAGGLEAIIGADPASDAFANALPARPVSLP